MKVRKKAPSYKLYNPADPKKKRKPKPGHPWARFDPTEFGRRGA